MQRVIFDAFQAGQPGQALALVSTIVFADVMVLAWVLVIDPARQARLLASGRSSIGGSANIAAGNPVRILGITGLVSVALIVLLLLGYRHDRKLFAEGGYLTVNGRLDRDAVIRLDTPPRRRSSLHGFSATPFDQYEWDRLTVGGRNFVVRCIRPADAPVGVVGSSGACLDQIEVGSTLRIDYFADHVEPVRIVMLDP